GAAVVAVNDDRAQVNDTLRAGLCGRVEDVRRARHVDSNEVVHRAPLVNVGGGVDDQMSLVERATQRFAVGDVGLHEGRSGPPDAGGGGRVDVESQHRGAVRGQPAADRVADEAAGPGDRGPATLEAPIAHSQASLYSPRLAQ